MFLQFELWKYALITIQVLLDKLFDICVNNEARTVDKCKEEARA